MTTRVIELLRYDLIIAVCIAVLLFVAGMGVGKYVLQRPVAEAKPIYATLDCSNLSMPQLEHIETSLRVLQNRSGRIECVTELPFKYIQAPHNNIRYTMGVGNLNVQADNLITDGRGQSMIPTFFEGNTLIVTAYNGQQLKPGMIVSYHNAGGEKLVHRVSSVYGDEIIVKGDANNAFDESISKRQVDGVVLGVLYT